MRKVIGSVIFVIGTAMFLRGLAYYTAALVVTDLEPGWVMDVYSQQVLLANQIIFQLGGAIVASLGVALVFWDDRSNTTK